MCTGQLVFCDSDFESDTSFLNISCQTYTDLFTQNMRALNWNFTRSDNGTTVTLEGPISYDIPVLNANMTGAGLVLLTEWRECAGMSVSVWVQDSEGEDSRLCGGGQLHVSLLIIM